ncbi:AlkA N-terminal domain-containing protein [Paraburkholderia ferrariae]|uniref:AlkA N-terminal domain-containing protein n=1 Tax=Paraburkholderia ferrariae TaxID=386056 RepID=A0ABU9RWA3_9BURK
MKALLRHTAAQVADRRSGPEYLCPNLARIRYALEVTLPISLMRAVGQLLPRVRRLFDLDARPDRIDPQEDDCLTGLFFVGKKHLPQMSLTRIGTAAPALALYAQRQITQFSAGERQDFGLPIALPGMKLKRTAT